MPENNSVALGINSNPVDLSKTLGLLSQLQLAQAHAGLYGLQAQQEARKLEGLAYLRTNPTDYLGAIQRGLDPSVGNTLQTMGERERQYGTNPQHLSTESTQQLTAAGRNIAETGKLGVETRKAGLEAGKEALDVGGRIAQMIISDPSDAGINRAHEAAKAAGVDTNPLVFQQFLRMTPDQRVQAAKAKISGGISPADYTAPHNAPLTENVTSRGAMLSTFPPPPGTVPQPNSQPATAVQPPNARVAQGFGSIPAMDPRSFHAEGAVGGLDAKYTQDLAQKAQTARSVNVTLDNIMRDAQNLPVGKGMSSVASGRAWLQSIYDNNIAGAKSWMPNPGTNATAAYDSILKNSGMLTRQALMQTHERAAVAYDMIQRQLPSIDTSRAGLARVGAEWAGINDADIAKQRVMATRPVAGRSDKFESEWNERVNPTYFILRRMDTDEKKQAISGLAKTEQGRNILNDIKSTEQYLRQNGAI